MTDNTITSRTAPARYSDKRNFEKANKPAPKPATDENCNRFLEDVVRIFCRLELRTWRLPRVSQVLAKPAYYATLAGIEVEELQEYIATHREPSPHLPTSTI